MKKLQLLFTAAALGVASMASAQINLNFGLGYHGGAFANNEGAMIDVEESTYDVTETALNYSMGGAIPITIGVGIPVSDNITLDANFEYRLGSSVTVADFDMPVPFSGAIANTVATAKSNQIRFMPSLMFHSGDDGLYGRFGLVLPVAGKTTITQETSFTGFNSTTTTEAKGAMSMGVVGGAGYKVELSRDLSFFGELQVIGLAIKSASSEVTAYEDNQGQSLEDAYPDVIDRETEYVEEVGPNDNENSDQPMKEIYSKTSYGSLGLNVGIRFSF